MERAVHFLVFDGLADWEAALALAELRRSGGYRVETVGFERRPVTTMGGLRVEVDRLFDELRPEETALLIVPGGEWWEQGTYPVERFEAKVREIVAADRPLAVICGAMVAAARAGILDGRAHTSADAGWLAAMAPNYAGHELHRGGLAVRGGNLITASPVGSVEFAREILSLLGAMPEEQLAIWFHLFKHGRFPDGVDPAQFFAA